MSCDSHKSKRLLIGLVLVACCVSVVFYKYHTIVAAQSTCTSTNTPGTLPRRFAWPQNALVSVNISGFTPEDFNCLNQLFEAYNFVNGAPSGNSSGVRFSVTYNGPAVATVAPNGSAVNAPGITYALQVNKQDLGDFDAGETYNGDDGTNRTSAVINLTGRINNCASHQMNLAHEIAHTLGLFHCNGCAAGSSVVNSIPCGQFDANNNCTQADWNNTSYGRTTPSDCDNAKIQQAGQYNPGTVNQPPPPSAQQPCPGVECNEGSGSQIDYCLYASGCPDGTINTGGCCIPYNITPILIDVDGSGFQLTSATEGVWFDFFHTGTRVNISWTAIGSTNAWLVLDRNSNGTIDSGRELFGNVTPQPRSSSRNGFLALAVFDKPVNGGNGDGKITEVDAIFESLRLWQDSNHNGVSEAGELHTLRQLGLKSIDLDYRESRRRDEHGNWFRYRAKVRDTRDAQLGRWAWDVFLVSSR